VQQGIGVHRIDECFGRQFIALEGDIQQTSSTTGQQEVIPSRESSTDLVSRFEAEFRSIIDRWQRKLSSLKGSAVVWGAGSKGTMFLNLVDASGIIEGIIDINPNKQGKFTPCTGHQILAPESLMRLKPQHVLIMNPMYREEIESMIRSFGLEAEMHVVN
jgi:hypothetical protein